MKDDEFFPVVDPIPGVRLSDRHNYRAKWTGAIRKPKAGEWYLSGATVAAYRAPNDLGTVYHIAKIVKVKMIAILVEVEEGARGGDGDE